MTSGRIQQVGFEDKPLRLHTGYMGVGRLLSVNNWTGGMGDSTIIDPETGLPMGSGVDSGVEAPTFLSTQPGGTTALTPSGQLVSLAAYVNPTANGTSNTTVAIVLAVCAGLVLLLAGKR